MTGPAHPLSAAQAILYGTLVVGALDALDAIVFFGFRGVTPVRIFQSIAAGLLGRPAFQGGLATAALGLCLHFVIAFLIVSVFYAASLAAPGLTRHFVVTGAIYGIAVYFVMNYLVLPLSAAGRGPFVLAVFINGVLIHALGVGVPSAWFARLASVR